MNVKCCHCGATLHVPDSYAGRDGNCNHCQGAITLPELPVAAARSIWDVTPENIGSVHIDPDKPLPKPVFIPEEPARVVLTPEQAAAQMKVAGCGALIFCTAVLVCILMAIDAAKARTPEGIAERKRIERTNKAEAAKRENNHDAIAAFVRSKGFVERQLLSPGSASFPFFGKGKPKGPNRWAVSSYVDSQNAMGALIRTHYSCTMVKIAEDDWRCEDLNLW